MQAMVLREVGAGLEPQELPIPVCGPEDLLVKVEACGVCRTDLHIVDGELPDPLLPLIPGHEIVGEVVEVGVDVKGVAVGARVGIPWLGHTCGACRFCRSDRENLCDAARFTGYQINGGYAEYTAAHHRFCFPLPATMHSVETAPLLCAGLIGYRSLRLTDSAQRLGIYGFGAAAHIITQVACHAEREIYAFTRAGDTPAQRFARQLGAVWAGSSTESPPELLDAAIIFAPAGELVPEALRHLVKGGVVVCAGIHMSDIPSFPYADLWGERRIQSVANLTRRDGEEFLALAARVPIRCHVESFPLAQANRALERLRRGEVQGAAVLVTDYGSETARS